MMVWSRGRRVHDVPEARGEGRVGDRPALA